MNYIPLLRPEVIEFFLCFYHHKDMRTSGRGREGVKVKVGHCTLHHDDEDPSFSLEKTINDSTAVCPFLSSNRLSI